MLTHQQHAPLAGVCVALPAGCMLAGSVLQPWLVACVAACMSVAHCCTKSTQQKHRLLLLCCHQHSGNGFSPAQLPGNYGLIVCVMILRCCVSSASFVSTHTYTRPHTPPPAGIAAGAGHDLPGTANTQANKKRWSSGQCYFWAVYVSQQVDHALSASKAAVLHALKPPHICCCCSQHVHEGGAARCWME